MRRDPVSAVCAVYAASVLGRRIRDMRADPTVTPAAQALWSMLAKPLLSDTAHRVLLMCRQRTAAQGSLRVNHIPDWIGNLEAIITAEGENQILLITAGKAGTDLVGLRLPDTSTQLPWYAALLVEREQKIAISMHDGSYASAGIAPGPDSAAIELATATAERLAATALLDAAAAVADPAAATAATSVAAVYALERIYARGAWYTEHLRMSPHRTAKLSAELHQHHALVAAHLPALVTAFDTPVLPAPIFSADYIRTWQDFAGWDDAVFSARRSAPSTESRVES
ncbi:hypothetical protein NBRGN_074_00390 [Nocardia brasiliensis NBRC 14402]|uniref:hypothetical protein n=1 Tax=Nocardia brasiliensis TaxID=37326 RepID=UPI0002D78F51|nr:hypothetical protein [Nocardia brasiliensis]GAJ84488.1 hypothetical protein NBRGN_074_00390 [Nocardia brasiliensis NBRC 14402]SUB47716.1 Uncharacterised protein [Nocardia brasiliensis]